MPRSAIPIPVIFLVERMVMYEHKHGTGGHDVADYVTTRSGYARACAFLASHVTIISWSNG